MSESTSQILLDKYADLYKRTVTHPLPKELCEGTLQDRALYIYLTQDLEFFETGLRLICRVTSMCPEVPSLITLLRRSASLPVMRMITSASDTVKEIKDKKIIPGVDAYIDYLVELTKDQRYDYPALISYLWCAEQCYLDWAHGLPKKEGLHWKHQTWIDLHDGEHFITWCEFLRAEVDKFSVRQVEEVFAKTLQHEFNFFDSCYKA
ncbi:related to Protein PET18 [Nakaseomyces glabratus]|nr:related to Protein PET18 [Nakaseomyces glabratus]SLM17297.1 related to Protein PET18 [Nakaseomyces glabratus]